MSKNTKQTKMANSWYSINARAGASKPTAEVYIYDGIGYFGISAKAFLDEVKALDVEEIELHLNTPGGDVFDGTAIYNILRNHKARVVTYIDGIAASMGSIIALAGDEVNIANNGYVMIHNPWSLAIGDSGDMRKEADVLDKIQQALAGIYSENMGITNDEARAFMDEETWWVGQEAVDAGFASSTYEGTKAAAEFDIENRFSKIPKEVLSRFSQTKTPPSSGTQPKTVNIVSMTEEEINALKAEKERLEEETKAQKTQLDAAEQAKTDAVNAARQMATRETAERITEINALGEKFGFIDDAKIFAKDGKTVDEFRNHILAKSPDDWAASLKIQNPVQHGGGEDIENQIENETDPSKRVALIRKLKREGK